jgi:alkaline phosphatase
MQTTYDAYALMTDSASAGTAFACGIKTRSGVIGMDESMTFKVKSIAQLAHEQGMKVGVVTSVSLDHATPASYYASVANRSNMNDVATQMANSGYEFFGGGGLVSPTGANRTGDTANNVWNLLTTNGYTILNTRSSILELKRRPQEKIVAINPWLQDSAAMPYAIDRPAKNLSLTEMTGAAINALYYEQHGWSMLRNEKGFFLMVEGGKIDWACHANDAMASIGDTLDFDSAIGAALEFYRQHPDDTLIVVTGDHETGGMSIGHATTGYSAYYDRLLGQRNSFQYFSDNQWQAHKATWANITCPNVSQPDTLSKNTEMLSLMNEVFGLKWTDLNAFQKKKLEDAYDMSLCGTNSNSSDENAFLYGGYQPIIVTMTHVLNERAGIGWTSYSHTGVPVPVYAQGAESSRFAGFYDNTDIAKKLAQIIGRELPEYK